MINVLIVDDQKSSRELLRYTLAENDNYSLLYSLDQSDKSEDFCRNNKVDLVLMDIHTSGKENGLDSAKKIKNFNPEIKIIIVTYLVQQEHLNKAREIGCEGFWYKDHSPQKLIEVMDEVMSGGIIYPDKSPVLAIGCAKSSDFTKQELQVLQLKVNGYSHNETCEILGIARSTLNFHISNLKGKTGYDNLLKLAIDVATKKFIVAEDSDMK